MPLATGARLGPYEVLTPIGKGGMGEVWQARDTRLGREVALKTLPEAFATDAQRLARFEREARLLASLNHPNIGSIYGLEESAGGHVLVLELVEGETLADRLRRGAIPIDEALALALQIAEALEAAHEKGVIHRDLKPANIKITPGGQVKVLDFGLAKTFEDGKTDVGSDPVASNAPTLAIGATQHGIVLGTAAYMSPEQARGQPTDRRGDIWAFGAVLYEMLTGRQAFGGATITDTLAAVLESDPAWDALPTLPPRVRNVLECCLQRDRRHRLRDIGDVRLTLEGRFGAAGTTVVPGEARPPRWRVAMLLAAGATAGAVVVGAAVWVLGGLSAPPVSEIRTEISTPYTTDPVSLALSPDGQKLVFVATAEGRSQLWLRRLAATSVTPLAGTEGAAYPFWSPDSQDVAFFAGNQLKRIDLAGGPAQVLANTPPGRGGTWNGDGVIVFAPTDGPLLQVADTGGEPVAVTQVEAPQQSNHRFPHFLPDGQHLLFIVRGEADVEGVYVTSLDGSPMRRVIDADPATAKYALGHLFFVRQGALWAQPFDTTRLEVTGEPFNVAERVAMRESGQAGLGAAVSVSASGSLAFRAEAVRGEQQLAWFDRIGERIRTLGGPDPADPRNPELSPDGRQVAIERTVNGNQDIWLLETDRGILNRLTVDEAVDEHAIWSPQSRDVVFQSNRSGTFDLYRRSTVAGGTAEVVLSTPNYKSPTDWSRDGRFVLFRQTAPETGYDLWALPMDGDGGPIPVVQTGNEERGGQFSPDAKWVAYQSNRSGRFEIYLQAFPTPVGEWQVSTDGGTQVRWRPDARELFYVAPDGTLTAVPVALDVENQAVDLGTPVPLFRLRTPGGGGPGIQAQQYDVSPDGRQFLVNTLLEDESVAPVTLVQNWTRAD